MAEDITFAGRRIFSGQGRPFEGHVKVCGKRIVSVGTGMPAEPGNVIDVGNSRIIPGLIDLHIHGSAGKNAVTDNIDDLVSMARFLADNGVTAFQPTSGAVPVPVLEKGIEVIRELTCGPVRGARSIGMHMEGPFLNPERKGAMPKELLLPPDLDLLKRWVRLGDGTINHVTVAPELPGALDLISYLVSQGITASAGHTFATFAEMMEGFRAGVTVSNHTYNAMRELHHREPGALGAALTQPGIFCELIADGIHVHPGAMRLLIQAKGSDYVCLITDAVLPAGLPRGEYSFLGRKVTIDESGKSYLPDGTIAGSTAFLRNCLRNVVEGLGIPFEVAVGMATVNPAKAARVWGRKGSLAPGKDADVVVLDDSYNVLWSMVEGEIQKQP
ncbi:MAG: N-acetylglucosamine-6-phosphate deacetylase [Bacillota bacterium]